MGTEVPRETLAKMGTASRRLRPSGPGLLPPFPKVRSVPVGPWIAGVSGRSLFRPEGVAARSRGQGGSRGGAGLHIPRARTRFLTLVGRPHPARVQQAGSDRSVSQTPLPAPKAAGRGLVCWRSGLGAALLCVSGEGCSPLVQPVHPKLTEMEVATSLSRLVLQEGEPQGPLVPSGRGAGAPA